MTLIAASAARAAAFVLSRRSARLPLSYLVNDRLIARKTVNERMPGRTMSSAAASTANLSIGEALAKLAEERPEMDVIRYEHKNVKWSFKHVEFFADALATGLLDQGLAPGDVVLSWLPSHFSEQHILQFACSKGGFVLYSLDPAQAITDPDGAKASLAKALEVTQANVLVSQEAGDDVHYAELCKEVIPEIRIFDFAGGMPFISPRYPHLRFPVHTGFEVGDHYGMVPLKHLLVPSGELKNLLDGAKIHGKTPVCGELVIDTDGVLAKGKVLTNEEVIKGNVWPQVSSILRKEYSEVEGLGVVF